MTKILMAGLLVIGLLTGCSTTLMDARGPSETCEVHHRMMRSVEVSGGQGDVVPTAEYVAARRRLFFHTYPYTLPRKWGRTYMIYLCDDCVAAEQEWKKQQKQQH